MTLNEAAQILGIPVNATADQVRKAFRKLALQWHPDRHPDNPRAAEKMMQKINEAHAVFLKHLERGSAQNSGASGSQSGSTRPGNSNTNTGRPSGSSARSNANDDPVVKMYWQYYQNAKRDHEKLISGELAALRKKLSETENELEKILHDSFGVDREKERKCVEKLSSLLMQHRVLIGRAKLYAEQMNIWLKQYNEAVARFEKAKSQGRR